MLRVLSAFLSVFCLLALVVRLGELALLFGAVALVLFAIDLLLASLASSPRVSRTRIGPLLWEQIHDSRMSKDSSPP